jgi:hypothetical protein
MNKFFPIIPLAIATLISTTTLFAADRSDPDILRVEL